MNREIKFRAWHKKQKRMFDVYGFNRHFVFEESLNDCLETMHKIEDCILLQYSGFKDRKGKEIYEGDIVKYTFDLPESLYATENGLRIRTDKVFWNDWRSSFAIGNKLSNNDLFRYVRNGNRVKVIGNIYENPELLEEKE